MVLCAIGAVNKEVNAVEDDPLCCFCFIALSSIDSLVASALLILLLLHTPSNTGILSTWGEFSQLQKLIAKY
jgi:hypothetical protein